jgi:hypothetical protein
MATNAAADEYDYSGATADWNAYYAAGYYDPSQAASTDGTTAPAAVGDSTYGYYEAHQGEAIATNTENGM